MGVSRKCVKTWIERYAAEGDAGLRTRSSRPHTMPTKTSAEVEAKVVAARTAHREGPDVLAPKVGVPARTVSRILRRHGVPYLRQCDPMTGEVIRSSKQTATRYERDRPGELVHVDVKKIGKIPDGGGWRAHGRSMGSTAAKKKARIGYDYVHSMVDDHSRLAYSEILPDEKGPTCGGFIQRAAAYFAAHGIPSIERVITDNHFSYRKSNDVKAAIAALGARHKFIRPIAHGRTARSNGSTAPWPPSGPTGRPSPPTTTAPPPLRPGSSTTTLNAATAHSEPNPPSAGCHQPDGRVRDCPMNGVSSVHL